MKIVLCVLAVVVGISTVDAGCCWKVKVAGTKGYGYINHNDEVYKVYKMEPGWVNGRPHYTSVDQKHSISYCKGTNKAQWVIQSASATRGKCEGLIFTNDDNQCVTDINYTWKFLNSRKKWMSAQKSLSVWCET